MILVIDNYDSFTYNLVQYLGALGAELEVIRNDRLEVKDVERLKPEKIILSPGPGTPEEAGICVDLVRGLGARIPILGVCLGHQAVGVAYGARISRAEKLMHGKTSSVYHDGSGLYQGLKNPFTATRYHSLVIDPSSVPGCLRVTARTKDGTIMGIRHSSHPVEGVQFHPESILTEEGKAFLANFLGIN